jgi:RimJ/RimL family protein N-acetyltransferase
MEYFSTDWQGAALIIRDLEPRDVPVLVEYWHGNTDDFIRSIGALPEKRGSREATTAMFEEALTSADRERGRRIFVVTYRDEVVAYALLNITSKENAYAHAHVVRPEWRGQGMASRLFGGMIETFLAQGVERIQFQTSPENLAINGLLQKFGLHYREIDIANPDGMARPGRFFSYELDGAALDEIRARLRPVAVGRTT